MDVDGTSAPDIGAIMFGLAGFRVLAAGVIGGELELLVETTEATATCPTCARPAAPHGRREHMLRDAAQGDRPVFVLWCKRIWRCRTPDCPMRTWSERSGLAAPKATLTGRVRAWAARRVGEHADTVAATARLLGRRLAHRDGRGLGARRPAGRRPGPAGRGDRVGRGRALLAVRERVPAQSVRHRHGRPQPRRPGPAARRGARAEAAPPTATGCRPAAPNGAPGSG